MSARDNRRRICNCAFCVHLADISCLSIRVSLSRWSTSMCVKLSVTLSRLNRNNTELCVKYVNRDYDDDEVTSQRQAFVKKRTKMKSFSHECCNPPRRQKAFDSLDSFFFLFIPFHWAASDDGVAFQCRGEPKKQIEIINQHKFGAASWDLEAF